MKRRLLFSMTVGTLLVLINQRDALMAGSLSSRQIWQILLIDTVPYGVSSLSSAQTVIAHEDNAESRPGEAHP